MGLGFCGSLGRKAGGGSRFGRAAARIIAMIVGALAA
jgi:hypothetical protein